MAASPQDGAAKATPGRLCPCGARLDIRGRCPALCTPVATPAPEYTGPLVVGSTHTGRLGKPVTW